MLAFAVTGCGGEREHGTATLWVTRDRGAQVLYTGTVPAGLTAMQALERARKVTTRYGGRFVQSIDGLDGSATQQHDWFYFVDGIEGDRSAAEVTLRPGDVEWWDYRSWTGRDDERAGRRRRLPAAVPRRHDACRAAVGVPPSRRRRTIAEQVDGTVASKKPATDVIIVISPVRPPTTFGSRASARASGSSSAPRAARKLAADPAALRYRYGVAP